MYNLLIHQWKEKVRSPFWQKNIWLNILLGILGIYLLMNIIIIGFFADVILKKIFAGINIVDAFTGILFYYFAFDLIIRFLVQKLPTLSIQPYLTLPIKKSTLLHYPLLKSVSCFINLIPVLLIVPFFIKVICSTSTPSFCLVWIITVFSLIATNNFLNFSLKKYFSERPILILTLFAIIGMLIYLDITKIISCSRYFTEALLYLAQSIWFVAIPISISVLSYYIGYYLLKKNAYIEDRQIKERINSNGFSFLSRYGEVGLLMRTEIKMILRNKRPKSMLYVSLMILAYGFIFYKDKNLDNYLILFFIGFFLTSAFAITYSQLSYSWESSFFDSYLANKISPYNYIKSKYLLFAVASFISYIVTLPYAFISAKIAYINTAMLLYNIGISSIIMLFLCTYNSTRIDLGRSQFMNYQGTGFIQYLSVIPLFGFPLFVHLLFKHFDLSQFSFYPIGFIGFIAIVFNKYLLKMVTNQFIRKRYKMALGFRQY